MKKIAEYLPVFKKKKSLLIPSSISAGLGLLVTFLIGYFQFGYSNLGLIIWILSITSFGFAFFLLRSKEKSHFFEVGDLKLILLLATVLIPFYFLFTYWVPFQMHTDEILEVILIKTLPKFDLFGLTAYDGYLQAKLLELSLVNNLIGPLSVFNLRIVGAIHALLAVVFSFVLFRMFSNRLEAFSAALLMGFSHTWIFFSRAFYLRLPPVLLEVVALVLLYKGVVSKCPFYSFLGGLAAGLGFYIYYPARIVILEAITFFIIVFLFFRQKYYKWELMRLFLAVTVGLIVAISPLFISTSKNNLQLSYLKKQILIFPEGRSEQQGYSNQPSSAEGIKTNISNGLTFLIKNVPDQAHNYTNTQFGFIDSITAILLWIGLLVIVFDRHRKLAPLLIAGSFILIITIFSFLVNYTPNYGRLLILFPFIGYLTMRGVVWVMGKFNWSTNSSRTKATIISSLLICLLNIWIFVDFSLKSLQKGDLLGQTIRYVDQRSSKANYTFFIAADSNYPYYFWGGHGYHWFAPLVSSNQHFQELQPSQLTNLHPLPPFTIFMNQSLWLQTSSTLNKNYPDLKLYFMTHDGNFLAVEVI